MYKKTDEIPGEIFDWLASRSFSLLSASQKSEVLQHLSSSEYDEMHETVCAIKIENTRGARKLQLLEAYEGKYVRKNGPAFFRVTLRAAAVFVPAILTALVVWYLKPSTIVSVAGAASMDTVYVTREIAATPLQVHDTVYRERKQSVLQHHEQVKSGQDGPVLQTAGDIYVVPLGELQNTSNAIKGNSMRDDTLWKVFGYNPL